MPKTYHHLTLEQRVQIKSLKSIPKETRKPFSNREIARLVGVHPSTIDRELKRNTGERGYRYKQADRLAFERRRATHKPFKMTPAVKERINAKLFEQWSPEQIAATLKMDKETPVFLCHETIYRYIIDDKAKGGLLYMNLRRKQKRYQKRVNGKRTWGQITHKTPLAERPECANNRERIGDWEADTMIGRRRKSAIVTLVERKINFTFIVKVNKNAANEVEQAITTAMKRSNLPCLTLTFDNGKEFTNHLAIAKELQAKCYFARPYHSWERGTNENTNGLIRQYFPKQTDFKNVTQEQLDLIQNKLNNRPRKKLNFNSPMQLYEKFVA